MPRFTDTETVRFADANNLKDVAWVDTTVHGTIVGFTNGTSRTVGTPTATCRTWPLKKKYRP